MHTGGGDPAAVVLWTAIVMTNTWQEALASFLCSQPVLVGIGNRMRGDDALGPMLADMLSGKVPWVTLDAGETPENYIGSIASMDPEGILLIDAARWGGAPGDIGFFPCDAVPWYGFSTHGISMRLFASLLAERTGAAIAVLGVEPRCLQTGGPLSVEVVESLRRIEQFLVCAAAHTRPCRGSPTSVTAGPSPSA